MNNDKTLLIQTLTIALADSCDISAKDLQDMIATTMNDFTVSQIDTTSLSTCDGSATLQIMKRFTESAYNQGLSEGTLKQYGYTVRDICTYTNKELNALTSEDINHYLIYCKARGCSNVTRDNKRRALSSLCSFMFNNKLIGENPMLNVDKIKVDVQHDKPLTRREVERIKIACEKRTKKVELATRDMAMICFMLSTGVRVSEMCGITLADIDFENRSVLVHGKGSKDRYVIYDEATAERLSIYLSHRADICTNDGIISTDSVTYLFASVDARHKALKKNGVEAEFRKLRDIAGIPRLHPHLLRSTFATRLAERNVPLTVIASMMGHCSITTTQIYVRMSDKKMQEYIEMVA